MVVSMDAGGTAFEISDPWVTSAVSVELTVEQSRELRDELDAYFGTPEFVECRTCGGTRKVEGMNHRPGDLMFACPDCTPENVDSPTDP